MVIECPSCHTKFQANAAAFGSKPRKVKCTACGHAWLMEPPDAPEALPAAESSAPEIEPEITAAAAKEELPQDAIDDLFSDDPAPPIDVEEVPARQKFSAALAHSSGKTDAIFAPPRRSMTANRIASLLLALMILFGIGVAMLQYKVEIARAWPKAGGLYAALGIPLAVEGIEIRNTSWSVETVGGMPRLTVRGEIHNASKESQPVPRVRLALRDADTRELYHWSAILDVKRLNPGETGRFTTTLPSPPSEAEDIEIRFMSDGDE